MKLFLRKWEELPRNMQNSEVRPYWEILNKKKFSLFCKRFFDFTVSTLMLVILFPFFLILALCIKLDSKGPVFFRQERITRYGRKFYIHKFRSMYSGADKSGPSVTVNNDSRVTHVGKFIRRFKIDELSQLIDVWKGDMSFVGTRPEVKKYTDTYTPEMMATLLLPAGLTSTASIKYRDENSILESAENVDEIYIGKILPEKMKLNLEDIKKFGFFRETGICFKTAISLFGK